MIITIETVDQMMTVIVVVHPVIEIQLAPLNQSHLIIKKIDEGHQVHRRSRVHHLVHHHAHHQHPLLRHLHLHHPQVHHLVVQLDRKLSYRLFSSLVYIFYIQKITN